MFAPSSPPLLDETLRFVERRYRLPAIAAPAPTQEMGPATALALAIERAREAVSRGDRPDAALKQQFTTALASLIHEAMHAQRGDPVFQATVLRHDAAQVREYASLAAHADRDRRLVHATVNAIAHPAKQQRMPPGRHREGLAQLHACAASAAWSALFDTARRLQRTPEFAHALPLERSLSDIVQCPALDRLRRLETLSSDELVLRYESLWDKNGPRSGSDAAIARGSASQQRGAAVEALAEQALQTLAGRLNQKDDSSAAYRVVTSLRVPATIPASAERAKSEWDVVLLRQAPTADARADAITVWDVCLFVEAKASVDAATTDLPRLLRGVRLLAHAEENIIYPFRTRQGTVCLRGASLRTLTTDEAGLERSVLYCCNAPAEATPRLLGAASRMQLLSAPASVAFASASMQKQHVSFEDLEPVWHDLLVSPRWRAVLHQYPTLRLVRELMVHTDDLLDAVNTTGLRLE